MREMRCPRTFGFLIWAGPTLVVGLGGLIGLVIAAASVWEGVKNWGEARYSELVPVVTTPWFLVLCVGLVVGYVGALFYCGLESAQSDNIVDEVFHTPIQVADVLYVDCDEITDKTGTAKVDGIYSVALCLQVRNIAQDGRTLRGLTAHVYNGAIHRSRLLIRGASTRQVDLRHGELELIEVGRVLVRAEPGSAPALVRVGQRQALSLEEINYAFNPAPFSRGLEISGDRQFGLHGQKGGGPNFYVVLSATDTSALELLVQANVWDNNPYNWLKIISKGPVHE